MRRRSSMTFRAVRPEDDPNFQFQTTGVRRIEGENPGSGTGGAPETFQIGNSMEDVRRRVGMGALIQTCPELADYLPEVQSIIFDLIQGAKVCRDEWQFAAILDEYKVEEQKRPDAQKTLFLMRLASWLPKIPEFTGKTAQGQPESGWQIRTFSTDLLNSRCPRIPVTKPDGTETEEHLYVVLSGIRL